MKDQLPGRGKEAKKDAEVLGSEAGAKLDQFSKDAKANLDKADQKLEQYRKDAESSISSAAKNAEKNLNAAVDKFDKGVSEVSGLCSTTRQKSSPFLWMQY